MQRIRVIDSHTAGEPTRVVVDGAPDLGGGDMGERRARLLESSAFRQAVIGEPRGSDVLVGAVLSDGVDAASAASVVYFDAAGCLYMCGHGTIGVAVTLGYLGRIGAGRHQLDTPAGPVAAEYDGAHTVTIHNVSSYRPAAGKGVSVRVPGYGRLSGDVAWGGNWFFITAEHGQELELANAPALTNFALAVRGALQRAGVRGDGGEAVDHVELVGPARRADADARSFVLCPSGAYDRSPCGTGTSAKMACLHADGHLQPGETWRQESVVGGLFEGSFQPDPQGGEAILPRITGEAYLTADATLLLDDADPFRDGLPRQATAGRKNRAALVGVEHLLHRRPPLALGAVR